MSINVDCQGTSEKGLVSFLFDLLHMLSSPSLHSLPPQNGILTTRLV